MEFPYNYLDRNQIMIIMIYTLLVIGETQLTDIYHKQPHLSYLVHIQNKKNP